VGPILCNPGFFWQLLCGVLRPSVSAPWWLVSTPLLGRLAWPTISLFQSLPSHRGVKSKISRHLVNNCVPIRSLCLALVVARLRARTAREAVTPPTPILMFPFAVRLGESRFRPWSTRAREEISGNQRSLGTLRNANRWFPFELSFSSRVLSCFIYLQTREKYSQVRPLGGMRQKRHVYSSRPLTYS